MDLEKQFDRARKSGNGGWLERVAEEKPAVGQHAGVHADAIDGAIAIVVELALDAKTESGEPRRERTGFSFEPAEFEAQRHSPRTRRYFTREEVHVTVSPGENALHAAASKLPILERVAPEVGADPGPAWLPGF